MFSSFFSFYFYIIHSFLRPQRKLFSTIVTTNAIRVIPLFLLNFVSKSIFPPPFYLGIHAIKKRQKATQIDLYFYRFICVAFIYFIFSVFKLPVCVYSPKGFSVFYHLHFYTSFFILILCIYSILFFYFLQDFFNFSV